MRDIMLLSNESDCVCVGVGVCVCKGTQITNTYCIYMYSHPRPCDPFTPVPKPDTMREPNFDDNLAQGRATQLTRCSTHTHISYSSNSSHIFS